MNRSKIITGMVMVVAIVSVIYSLTGGQSKEDYIAEIADERKDQAQFMQDSEESPFNNSSATFTGLNYYDVDPAYKVNARFTPVEKQTILTLGTNDNKERQYLTYGYAEFDLNDKHNKLLILENATDGTLFLAFGDETSANETYGAGRYLDVTHSGGRSITLDFNLAYNPFCAYADDFTCPLPPRENLLSVAIEAGEKSYH